MSKAIPSIGDRVIYHPTSDHDKQMSEAKNCNSANVLPATVVAEWGTNTVNLKVHFDGDIPDVWVTSANKGLNQGEWEWPWEHEQRVG